MKERFVCPKCESLLEAFCCPVCGHDIYIKRQHKTTGRIVQICRLFRSLHRLFGDRPWPGRPMLRAAALFELRSPSRWTLLYVQFHFIIFPLVLKGERKSPKYNRKTAKNGIAVKLYRSLLKCFLNSPLHYPAASFQRYGILNIRRADQSPFGYCY